MEEWVVKTITVPVRTKAAPVRMSGHRTQPRPDTSRATMMLMAESGRRIRSDLGCRVVGRSFHPLAGAVEGGVDAERDDGLAKVGAQELLVPSEHLDVDQGSVRASLPDDERCAGSDGGW